MNDLEKWESGLALSTAYFEFTNPYQREKYRNARGQGPMQAYEMLMCAELFDKLATGKQEAFGFQVEPIVSGNPVAIPRHCFMMQRPDVTECNADTISASGLRYERVRVVVASETELPVDTTLAPLIESKPRLGRPPTYRAAYEALSELRSSDPANIRQPPARLLEKFNAIYPTYAAKLGLPAVGLSERKLRDHLKLFRQESAEIGNNNSAN